MIRIVKRGRHVLHIVRAMAAQRGATSIRMRSTRVHTRRTAAPVMTRAPAEEDQEPEEYLMPKDEMKQEILKYAAGLDINTEVADKLEETAHKACDPEEFMDFLAEIDRLAMENDGKVRDVWLEMQNRR